MKVVMYNSSDKTNGRQNELVRGLRSSQTSIIATNIRKKHF